MNLYPHQKQAVEAINYWWNRGYRNTAYVLPTGGGKTTIFTNILSQQNDYSIVIAHRQELVQQISTALAYQGVYHDVLATKDIIKWIRGIHYVNFGADFIRPKAKIIVSGVRTLLRRFDKLPYKRKIKLWIIDECHHIAKNNEWHKAVNLFPSARGLGVTATFLRMDGSGLGAHSDGVFHKLIVGPNMRTLINQGYLSDYIIYGPTTRNFSRAEIPLASNGDFNKFKMRTMMRRTPIIGDIVDHYRRYAMGKTGVTFVESVETALIVATRFNAERIPAAVVHAGTKDKERQAAVQRLKNGELLQLVNVDIFGEGFDLPAIEVVSFARPTESYGLYCQQFGRSLRVMDGKPYAIIIDHVGNVMKHGLPDYGRNWSLERRDKKQAKDPNIIRTRTCPMCTRIYPLIKPSCPYCGFTIIPTDRSKPEFVDGDLTLLDAATLEKLRGEIRRVNMSPDDFQTNLVNIGMHGSALNGAVFQHRKRLVAQIELQEKIAQWAGIQRAINRPDAESYRLFNDSFGVDVMTAQTLGRPEAERLTKEIEYAINNGRN